MNDNTEQISFNHKYHIDHDENRGYLSRFKLISITWEEIFISEHFDWLHYLLEPLSVRPFWKVHAKDMNQEITETTKVQDLCRNPIQPQNSLFHSFFIFSLSLYMYSSGKNLTDHCNFLWIQHVWQPFPSSFCWIPT